MVAKLWCFGESGSAYKVALTMTLSEVPWQPIFVDFFNGEARSPAFLEINPMGEVPVLELDGRIISQSGVMLTQLAAKTGRYGGQTPEQREEILRWLFWDNHKLSTLIGSTRFLRNFLPETKRPAAVIAFQESRLKASYKVLEAHLSDKDWMVGQAPSIADFSLCAYLYYPEPFGFDPAEWPAIRAWLARIAALPGWVHPFDLMPRKAGADLEKAPA